MVNPVTASSRATASGGSAQSSGPRLSASWSRRRAPRMGCTAGDFVIVQAIAT
jgi:hypothetical protein